ncbi:MAG: hypothetical protein IK038_03120 [Bacteroidaceae bacterium]|nr:hypothetical protein [Bacteroidaceae bacterium]
MLKALKNLLKPIVLRRCKKDTLKKYDAKGNMVREYFFSLTDDSVRKNLFTYNDQNRMVTWVSLVDGKVDMVVTHSYDPDIGQQKNYEYENGKRVVKRHSIRYYDENGALVKSIVNGVERKIPTITKEGNTEIEQATDENGTQNTWQTIKDKNGRDLFSHCHSVEINGTICDFYTLTTYGVDGQLRCRINYREYPNSSKASYYSQMFCNYDMYGRILSSNEESSYGYYKSRHCYSADGTEDFYTAESTLTGDYYKYTKKTNNVETEYIVPPRWAFIFK